MSDDIADVAADLRLALGALLRRLRAVRAPHDPTVPETTVLARLDREGPTTAAELARREQISPQSMGAIIATLLDRGLITRSPDPSDGRRVLLSPSASGRSTLGDRRNARTQAIADALVESFDEDEITTLARALPLLQRLADTL